MRDSKSAVRSIGISSQYRDPAIRLRQSRVGERRQFAGRELTPRFPRGIAQLVGVAWLRRSATSDQPGRISGLFFGNLAIVDWSVLKVAATIAGGVCVSQSDRETSSKRSLLNTSRNCKSVSPVFLT